MRRFVALLAAACLAFAVSESSAVCQAEEVFAAEEDTEDDGELRIAPSFDSLPIGAEEITFNYKGEAIRAAKIESRGLYLLPVESDEGGVVWYVYNEESDKAVPYKNIVTREDTFTVLPLEEGVEVPEGYEEVSIGYDGTNLPAWIHVNREDSDFYLVYGQNSNLTKGFYRYDGPNGMVFRFVEDPTLEPTTAETEAATDNPALVEERDNYSRAAELHQTNFDNLQKKYNKDFMMGTVALGICGALLVLFLLLIILQSSRLRKAKKEVEESETKNLRRPSGDTNRRKKPEAEKKPGSENRSERREDGTSQVRKARKDNDPRLERSTTTSAARRVNKDNTPAEEQKAGKPASGYAEADESVYRPESKKRRTRDESGTAIRESGDISGTGEVRRVKKEVVPDAPVKKKPTRAAAIDELDELEDVSKAAADTAANAAEDTDELFQASSAESPDLDTAGLEKIAEQLKKYNLGDDLPDDDELPDLDGADDSDEDFAVTDYKDI